MLICLQVKKENKMKVAIHLLKVYDENIEQWNKNRRKHHLSPISLIFFIDDKYNDYKIYCNSLHIKPLDKGAYLRSEIN